MNIMKRRKRKRRTARDVFDINKTADDTIREWLNNGSSSIIPEDPIFPPIKESGQFVFNSKFKIYCYNIMGIESSVLRYKNKK